EDIDSAGQRVHAGLKALGAEKMETPSPVRFLIVTIEDILRQFVALIEDSEADAEALLQEAFFVWEAQASNALLRVWESVIAAMAESSEGCINRSMAIESILFGIDRGLRTACRGLGQLQDSLHSHIESLLNQSVQLVFDPSIGGGTGVDGVSSQGGFRLQTLADDDRLVTCPSEFQSYVKDIISRVKSDVLVQLAGGTGALDEVLKKLSTYVDTDNFVQQAIRSCGFHKLSDPIRDHSLLQFTPWCMKAGANFKDVLATYFGVTKRPKFQWAFCPKAEDLLKVILRIMSEHQAWIEKSTHPRKILPARAQGMHVFSLMLDDPSMRGLMRVEDVDAWLEANICSQGLGVAQAPITHETRIKMITFCFDGLLLNLAEATGLAINLDNRIAYHTDLIDAEQQSSVKEWRDEVLEILESHIQLDWNPDLRETLRILVDEELIRSLPKSDRSLIAGSALRFGDTHWLHRSTLRDIYFCFVYNPGSCRFELAKILDDNSDIQLLCQREWLQERNWEFCSAIEEGKGGNGDDGTA
ncbi:MAG: hypothetical protein KDK78_09605, partial [Chlamydiia bacterium]|nr:hypothetical protein [Chlamydiia bacterium]